MRAGRQGRAAASDGNAGASIDRERLAQALKLDRAQRIVLAQSIGYPAQ
jgi:hypothetical protein